MLVLSFLPSPKFIRLAVPPDLPFVFPSTYYHDYCKTRITPLVPTLARGAIDAIHFHILGLII